MFEKEAIMDCGYFFAPCFPLNPTPYVVNINKEGETCDNLQKDNPQDESIWSENKDINNADVA